MRPNQTKLTIEELQKVAFDMRKDGYNYEAIAEFLNTSKSYAKTLVTQSINKERMGTWKKN